MSRESEIARALELAALAEAALTHQYHDRANTYAVMSLMHFEAAKWAVTTPPIGETEMSRSPVESNNTHVYCGQSKEGHTNADGILLCPGENEDDEFGLPEPR